jgi:LPS-assembly protein
MLSVRNILIAFFLFLGCLVVSAEDILQLPELKTTGTNATSSLVNGHLVISGGVEVRYRDLYMVADEAELDQNTGNIRAKGSVRVERNGEVWIGEQIDYNYKTRQFSGIDFKTGLVPYFARGHNFTSDQQSKVYTAEDVLVTTDDYADPGYSVRAKRITIVPGEYIRAEQATVRIGKLPGFYIPVWKRSLRRHPNHWVMVPGYRTKYGPYLLSSYHYQFSDHIEGVLDIDARQKRGFGYGPELRYDLPKIGAGEMKYYRTRDDNPGLDPLGNPISHERQRAWFEHQATLNTNFTFKASVKYQRDAQVIRDFFETEYRENVQPATYFEFAKSWSNWSLNALAQPRVNDFFDTVERLPDLKLTGLRQQLRDLPLFYDSDSSIGYFRRRFADSGTNGFGAFRGDTYHQVTLPHTFFNWLTITPRVGGRATYYGEEDGYGSRRDEQDRYVFNTGAELTTKASRVWQGAESRFFEIDGLRHILQPSINYVYVPRPSRPPRELPQFDYELPSRRLLPIEYPDYNRIDSVDSQNVLRLGLRNKLQTKRSGVVEDFATWALYTDWRLRPLANQATFADIYSDAEFAPFHWLSLSSELRYNVEGEYWKEANHYLTLLPGPDWSLSVGHRYLRDDPFYGVDSGHNLISTRFYYRFNENWGFRATHHFEARDGTMEEQIYTMYRDFRSWTGALSFRIRESRGGEPRDYTIGVIFNLKAFPRFKLKDDVDKPSMLFGG